MRFLSKGSSYMPYHYKYNRTLLPFSKQNKKASTETEKKLWSYLRNRQLQGYKFRRQYPIRNWIVDFYCVEVKLGIELDGSQHEINKTYDENRSNELMKQGILIIRFWDNDVFQNIEGVLEEIAKTLEARSVK